MKTSQLDRLLDKVDVRVVTGCWEWTASRFNSGYGRIRSGGKYRSAHRVAYELLVGMPPQGLELDHVCHNKICVNPNHLRLATVRENRQNALIRRDNSSGFKGVVFLPKCKKWRAMVRRDGVPLYLGIFESPELAHKAYCDAAIKYYGNFANFGHCVQANKEVNK